MGNNEQCDLISVPQLIASLAMNVEQLICDIQGDVDEHKRLHLDAGALVPSEEWHLANSAEYLAFIERELAQVHQLELHMNPLVYILTRYDRSLFCSGLWLEFGVSE